MLLCRDGHIVAATRTIDDALQLLNHFRFDALVSDIGLPDGDGFALVAEAKRRQPLSKAIAVTACSSAEERARGQMAGFDHFFAKPLDRAQLRRALAA